MIKTLVLKIENTVVLNDILLADSFLLRLKGYMWDRYPRHKGILLKNCHDIHSFGMRFNLDLYFLDQDFKLIQSEKDFQKNRALSVRGAHHVLETPAGALKAYEFFIGQHFVLEASPLKW